MAALAQATTMEDFGSAAATKAALLLVIGEPVSEDHKHLIPEELAKGFRTWDVDATGVDINDEVSQVASKASLGEEGPYVDSYGPLKPGERVLSCCTGPLSIEVLIAPQTTTVKRALKNFLGAPVKYHHLIYAGHALVGSGEWILQDDTFKFADFASTFKDPDVENALKQQEEAVLNIHCFATGDWNNANLSKVGTKVLQINLNPEDKLSNLGGVTQFNTYLCNHVKPRSLKEMLRSSDVVGNIRFSKPTLYVFPGCQGDSALFGISGFNLLVNGGYNKKACFWDFTRHLDRIDAMLLSHLGIDNIFGMNSVLQRKSIENVHPEIGHVYFNAYKGTRNSQDESETEGKPNNNNSLLVNLAVEGDKIVDNVRSLGQTPNPCYRSATATTIEPVNLYHKVGHGSLDMYILNPVQDSKELKEFYQHWSKQSVQNSSSSQFSLPNVLSVCALLIWRPADQTENITRIFFPGNAPQHKIIEGLEKLKTLNVLKVPKCCDKELNAPKAGLKKSVPSKTSATSRGPPKPAAAKTEVIKRESKVDLKSKAPAPRTNKLSKEDTNNKKASKTKEKGDKPKPALVGSRKVSPPTEAPPFSSKAPAPATVPVPAPIKKESPPDLVQKDNNLLVDFGSAPVQEQQQQQQHHEQQQQQHTTPASDNLLDLIGHSSMKAESEQLLASDPASFMNNQSPDPLPDPSHVEHDTTGQPEEDQINSGLNHKEMEDMGIYDDDMIVHRERSDDAVEADKLVSSSSDDKGFEEYDEEVQPESLPEPDLIMGSQPLQYGMPAHGFGGKLDSMNMDSDMVPTYNNALQEPFSREEPLTSERSDPVESLPVESPSDGFDNDMGYDNEQEDGFEQDMHNRDFSPNPDMTNSVYGNLMERSVPSAEAFEQLQQECTEMENRIHESSSQEDFESQQEIKEFSPESEGQQETKDLSPDSESPSPECETQQEAKDFSPDSESPSPDPRPEEVEMESPVEEEVEEEVEKESLEEVEKESPVEEKEIPVEESPIEEEKEIPVEESPVEEEKEIPVEESPVEEEKEIPVEETPVEEEKEIPVEEPPVEEEKEIPVEEPPVEEEKEPLVEESPVVEEKEPLVEESPVVEEKESPVEEEMESTEEEESPEPVKDDSEDDAPKPDEDQERSSPEGFDDHDEKDEEQPEVAVQEDENKENDGPPAEDAENFDMHHSDSGTAFDEQAEDLAEKESADEMMNKQNEDHGIYDDEDEDSEEVASQPGGDEPQSEEQLDMQDEQDTTIKVDENEADVDSESQTASSLPAAFEKDETPQPGDKPVDSCSDQEDRDDTDSIDGGTPEDEKDIDETFESSKEQASDADKNFDPSTPHPAWSTTSNLSPLAPPFDPSGNQAFDPFSQHGANDFSEDDKNGPGNFKEYESGFGEVQSSGAFDEKTFDPAEEWGRPMNLPSPPPLPPEVKKSNGVATRKPTSKSPSARTTDRKLADTKKPETKKPATTLGRSPKPALDRKAGLVKTDKPEKKLSNGDTDVKSKPRSATSILDKSKSSHTTAEKKPLTKTRPTSAKSETKTSNSALKTEAKPKLSSAKRPSTTPGSRASPASKAAPPLPPHTTFYVDLTYIPNHGDPAYSDIEFFKRIRARYYVLSALSPNPQILNALLEAKQTWEDKNLEVTVIPTYDNETLRHWMGLHRDELTDLKIDVAPSASRCTIQLQDHETSCSAYRLEF